MKKKIWRWLWNAINKDAFKEELFLAIISNLIFAFIVGLSIYGYQSWKSHKDKEWKILQIDEYNLGIACLTKRAYKQNFGMLAGKYDSQVYKENFDFISNRSRKLEELILENITYMDSSNIMLDIALKNYPNLAPKELGGKIYTIADKVEKNIREYDVRVREAKCEL